MSGGGATPGFSTSIPMSLLNPTTSGAPAADGGGGWTESVAGIGLVASTAGALLSAVGGYYAALSHRNELKSRALSVEYERSVANQNARQAEEDAQALLEQGQQQQGLLSMQRGQERAARATMVAKSGVVAGVGSAAEVAASEELVAKLDAMTINANAVRAAGAARMRSAGYQNASRLAGVSAANLRGSARTVSPGLAATTSLLNSAGSVASQWYTYGRRF